MKTWKKSLCAAMAISMILSASACSKEQPKQQAEIGDIQGLESSPEVEELAQGSDFSSSDYPSYDKSNLPVSKVQISKELQNVYYLQNMDTRMAICYNDIRNALLDKRTDIVLSKSLTPEELFQIMAILYTNDIEVFSMDSSYAYQLSGDGYIQKISLMYREDEAHRQDIEGVAERTRQTALELFKNLTPTEKMTLEEQEAMLSDYQVVQNIITQYFSDIRKMNYATSRQDAMTFSYYCRYLGIPCMVKIGILTDENMINLHTQQISANLDSGGGNIRSLNDVSKMTKQENDTYYVDFSMDDFVYWNMVQINNRWYNIDLTANTVLMQEENENQPSDWFTMVNDYTMSMSRIFKYTDDILGASPSSEDIQFGSIFRSGDFYLHHNETQIRNHIFEEVSLYKSKNLPRYVYQFYDEETFDYFVKNFEDILTNYNADNNTPIVTYEIKPFKEVLVIWITNVTYR